MQNKNCKWCQSIFQSKSANFCSVLCRNRLISSKNDYKSISQKLKYKPISCKECEKLFEYAYKRKFCSRTCSAKNNNRNRDKKIYEKQSETIRKSFANGKFKPFRKPKKIFKLICFSCEKEFEVFSKQKTQKYCVECKNAPKNPITYKQSLADYRSKSKFKFNLADYPKEFDFKLIKKHGWYSPTNKKNNLNGVSRDHIISVKFGHDNNLPPEIISHPANCQLLVHSNNVSKHSRCDISLEDLKSKIVVWNIKYLKSNYMKP